VGRDLYQGARNGFRARREMLFLSHANPEDDLITGWLALQLAREGYAVWSDLTKLLGGEAFWDDIQAAIEYRTVKFLYVLSRSSNSKDGPLAELAVARDVERKLKLRDFIIPLQIDDLPHNEMHILLRRLNTIPFRRSWAAGLNQLVQKLRKEKVPTKRTFGPKAVNEWWKSHFSAETGIQRRREEVLSNYFDLERLPEDINIHALTPGCARDELSESLTYPAIVQGDSLIAFAPADDFAAELGDGRIWRSHSVKLEEFLPDQQNRNHVYMLLRIAWEKMAEGKGLQPYTMSGGKAFWFAKDQVLQDRVAFPRPDGTRGYRGRVVLLEDQTDVAHSFSNFCELPRPASRLFTAGSGWTATNGAASRKPLPAEAISSACEFETSRTGNSSATGAIRFCGHWPTSRASAKRYYGREDGPRGYKPILDWKSRIH
jgi:TIR domain-containing protein